MNAYGSDAKSEMAEQISLSLSQSCTQGFDALRALLVLRTHLQV